MNDTINEALNAAKERFTGPLGYISISFIIYNWSWFYYIIFSNKLAEVKISYVKESFPLYSGIGYPVAFGVLMALFMPFFSAWLKKLTYHAEIIKQRAENDAKNFSEDYSAEKKVAIANKNYEVVVKTAKVEEIQKRRDTLLEEVTTYQQMQEDLQLSTAQARDALLSLTQKSQQLDFDIAFNENNKAEMDRLRETVASQVGWKNISDTNIQSLSKELTETKTKLETLSRTIKRVPNWDGLLNDNERDEMLIIANEVGS